MKDFKLCFIANSKAYFTTQALDKQWGDDWDDAPYEHNAGIPYEWRKDSKDDSWQIYELYFESNLNTPDYGHSNSPYTAQAINRGEVAWLESPSYEKEPIRIFAGESCDTFIEKIKKVGGKVYLLA